VPLLWKSITLHDAGNAAQVLVSVPRQRLLPTTLRAWSAGSRGLVSEPVGKEALSLQLCDSRCGSGEANVVHEAFVVPIVVYVDHEV